jgi:Protein of unknown function (DUF3376)
VGTEKAREQVRALVSAETSIGRSPHDRGVYWANEIVRFFLDNYLEFDTALFPILYDTDVGTPELVSVTRVSPDDARSIYDPFGPSADSSPGSGKPLPPNKSPKPAPLLGSSGPPSQSKPSKLAGATLAHFGAFLDRSFRSGDILWGRLDAAERIVRALLGMGENADRLINQAQMRVIRDFLGDRKQELAGVICEVAKSLSSNIKTEDAKAQAIHEAAKQTLGALPNQQTSQAVEAFLTSEQILGYLRQPLEREPERPTTLNSIARSVRIVGGMLQSVGEETKSAGKTAARVGTILWLLVQAAIPDGLASRFADKAFAALFWFAIVMLLGGVFFNQAVQSVGIKLLFVTTLLWLVKDAFQRYVRGGKRALKVTAVLVVVALLLGIGTLVLTGKLQPPHPAPKAYQWVHDRIGRLISKNPK